MRYVPCASPINSQVDEVKIRAPNYVVYLNESKKKGRST